MQYIPILQSHLNPKQKPLQGSPNKKRPVCSTTPLPTLPAILHNLHMDIPIPIPINALSNPTAMNLNQKGIIVDLLARVCLMECERYRRGVEGFLGELWFGGKGGTTVRKRRTQYQGNTTTVKRKRKPATEIGRNGISLDQMLEIQLSSPSNTQLRSQEIDDKNQLQQLDEVKQVNIDMIEALPALIPDPMQILATPLKPIQQVPQKQLSSNWQQYQQIINPTSHLDLDDKSAQQPHTRTRKKPTPTTTQHLPQLINADISLPSACSQLPLRKEVENILEATKKKKMAERGDLCGLLGLEIFQCGELGGIGDLGGIGELGKLTEFYAANYGLTNYNYNHQTSSKAKNSQSQTNNIPNLDDRQSSHPQQTVDIKTWRLAQKLKFQFCPNNQNGNKNAEKCVNLENFANENQFNNEDKSMLFYYLLCRPEEYAIRQDDPSRFGELHILLNFKS